MIRNKKLERRLRTKTRIRKKVQGSTERPRLIVFRSSTNVYAQIIDDTAGKTLAAASTLSKELKEEIKNAPKIMDRCKLVGKSIAKLAKEKNITKVVFDRNGYKFHGRVKAIADGAREGGLKF